MSGRMDWDRAAKRSLSGKQDQDGQRRRLEKEATRLLTGRPVKRIGKRKAKR